MLSIHLKKSRERPVKNGHPWIFSGAIQMVEGAGGAGEQCRVLDAAGTVLGRGYYNEKSSITVRMLTKGDTEFDTKELASRIKTAVGARTGLMAGNETDSCRLVNAEGDFLPGLIVDRYADGLCVQILTAGMERMRGEIFDCLRGICGPAFTFERSDTDARTREGLERKEGLVSGTMPDKLRIRENGLRFSIDLSGGQKTGFYFDQRENRLRARTYACGKRCLDCFSYSGAFGLNLLAAGAIAVTAVDAAKNSAAWCAENLALNGFEKGRIECVTADAFEFLRSADADFDLIVLDPPKFAKRPSEAAQAARGYKDINLCALKRLSPGGILCTFSCSNAIDSRLFRQIVFSAAADAGSGVQLLHILSAGPDHPVSLSHPEGEYLKGLILKVQD